MKEATGASEIPDGSKYPHAAAMIQPTRSPTITETEDMKFSTQTIMRYGISENLRDFMIGEPNRSDRIIVTKTENPRPMN